MLGVQIDVIYLWTNEILGDKIYSSDTFMLNGYLDQLYHVINAVHAPHWKSQHISISLI